MSAVRFTAVPPSQHQLPPALPDGVVAFVFPIDGIAPFEQTVLEDRPQAHTLGRLDLVPLALGRIRCPGQVHGRGHDVDQVARLMDQGPLALDMARPMSDQRCGYAALVGAAAIVRQEQGGVRSALPPGGETGQHAEAAARDYGGGQIGSQ